MFLFKSRYIVILFLILEFFLENINLKWLEKLSLSENFNLMLIFK